MVYYVQILHNYTFKHCLDTGRQNDNEVLLSISVAGQGLLNFTYLYILRLSLVYQIKLNNYKQFFFIEP